MSVPVFQTQTILRSESSVLSYKGFGRSAPARWVDAGDALQNMRPADSCADDEGGRFRYLVMVKTKKKHIVASDLYPASLRAANASVFRVVRNPNPNRSCEGHGTGYESAVKETGSDVLYRHDKVQASSHNDDRVHGLVQMSMRRGIPGLPTELWQWYKEAEGIEKTAKARLAPVAVFRRVHAFGSFSWISTLWSKGNTKSPHLNPQLAALKIASLSPTFNTKAVKLGLKSWKQTSLEKDRRAVPVGDS
ncbi:hypothetical protein B0H19DRAFT_1083403 [Mycena capillaripes]|nr:hypothetical protein B0H19DRAFT_1083403 [Mycena capillaripes]